MITKVYMYDDISTEQWVDILQDKNMITDAVKNIFRVLYETENKKLNGKAIAEILGYEHHLTLNNIVGRCGRRIKNNYDISTNAMVENEQWLVVFNGDEVKEQGKLYFNWILKDNMIEAFEQLCYFDESIRILPMNGTEEFDSQTAKDVQINFFMDELISRNGKYYFKSSGMKAETSTLVLFQYDNSIIASAKLCSIEKLETQQHGYAGAYYFDVSTIEIFEPITIEEMKQAVPTFKRFSQAKQNIPAIYTKAVKTLIHAKKFHELPEEIPDFYMKQLTEGAKKQITVNAYERNQVARNRCLEHYGYACVVCNFDFSEFYGEEFKGKIHVHHLKPLSDINEQYVVDPIKDLRPVCPNCHMALHSKKVPYTIEELQQKIKQSQ